MLEKMGWSSGKGLGANEQGSTNHIKVNVKNNNLGVGAAVNQEDKWIAHQDDFNQLLADLNDQHGQQEATEQVQKAAFSLEEKSKRSRKRVHYMKFAKGKDLSTRSADDLACVFGKRAKKSHGETERDAPASVQESEEEQCVSESPSPPPVEPEADDGLRTTTSALSVQEYFARKMADARRGAAAAAAAAAVEDGRSEATPGRTSRAGRKRTMAGDVPGGEEGDPRALQPPEGEDGGPELAEDAAVSVREKKKRKKDKKRRRREELEEEVERANPVEDDEESAERDLPSGDVEQARKKKKEKKKKKNKNRSRDSD
ncbi:PIN2/TERF1-interacting telomerase inhibitor 1 isoform X2 [Petromyzon marinus]|nr:PIN2/TERF1-interacting telomerase inhibitor 1 isoform X2 [Petromyzon marinus]